MWTPVSNTFNGSFGHETELNNRTTPQALTNNLINTPYDQQSRYRELSDLLRAFSGNNQKSSTIRPQQLDAFIARPDQQPLMKAVVTHRQENNTLTTAAANQTRQPVLVQEPDMSLQERQFLDLLAKETDNKTNVQHRESTTTSQNVDGVHASTIVTSSRPLVTHSSNSNSNNNNDNNNSNINNNNNRNSSNNNISSSSRNINSSNRTSNDNFERKIQNPNLTNKVPMRMSPNTNNNNTSSIKLNETLKAFSNNNKISESVLDVANFTPNSLNNSTMSLNTSDDKNNERRRGNILPSENEDNDQNKSGKDIVEEVIKNPTHIRHLFERLVLDDIKHRDDYGLEALKEEIDVEDKHDKRDKKQAPFFFSGERSQQKIVQQEPARVKDEVERTMPPNMDLDFFKDGV